MYHQAPNCISQCIWGALYPLCILSDGVPECTMHQMALFNALEVPFIHCILLTFVWWCTRVYYPASIPLHIVTTSAWFKCNHCKPKLQIRPNNCAWRITWCTCAQSWEPFHISIVSILLCASHQQHGRVIWCKNTHIMRKDKNKDNVKDKDKDKDKDCCCMLTNLVHNNKTDQRFVFN